MRSLVTMKEVATNTVESNSRVRKIQWNVFLSLMVAQPAIRRKLSCSRAQVMISCPGTVALPVGENPHPSEFLSLKHWPVAPKPFGDLPDLARACKHVFKATADLPVVDQRIKPLAILV